MATSGTKKTAQRVRKGTRKRKQGLKTVCKGRGSTKEPQASTVVAACITSLSLPVRTGIEVFLTVNTGKHKVPVSMADQLVQSCLAAEKHWGQNSELPAELLSIKNEAQKITALTKHFSSRFVKDGLRVMIEEWDPEYRDNPRYVFTLIRECEWNGNWQVMEVKKLLAIARTCGKPMVKVLFLFLKAFQESLSAGTWYNGHMDMCYDWLEERSEEWEYDIPDDDPEVNEERTLWKDLQCYRYGAAATAARTIQHTDLLEPDEIIKRVNRIRIDHPLKRAIIAGCELMKQPYNIDFFDHPDCAEDFDNGIDAVSFYDQVTILWEYEDAFTNSWQEWLNCKHNESGHLYPISVFRVDPRQKDWDRTRFDACMDWPKQMAEVFTKLDAACISIEEYKKQQRQLINNLV